MAAFYGGLSLSYTALPKAIRTRKDGSGPGGHGTDPHKPLFYANITFMFLSISCYASYLWDEQPFTDSLALKSRSLSYSISNYLWPPYVIGQAIIVLTCGFFLSSSSLFLA